jgi:hypothetical protein
MKRLCRTVLQSYNNKLQKIWGKKVAECVTHGKQEMIWSLVLLSRMTGKYKPLAKWGSIWELEE